MGLIEKLTNIADAIREKTGGTEKLSLDGMAEAIAGISAGGGDEQSVLDSLIDRSITEIRSNVTSIGNSAFQNCKKLTSADFPLVTSIGQNAFNGCSVLTSADFPLVTSIYSFAFSDCEKLTSADFPLVIVLQQSAFNRCSSLTSANLPSVRTAANALFSDCPKLTSVDLLVATIINLNVFKNCYNLKAVILRSDIMCDLFSTSAFTNCYHFYGTVNATYNPEGLKDGYIYVPRALLSDDDATKDYRRATNWSAFATQFRALEDYTVDGTTTGALDESKI